VLHIYTLIITEDGLNRAGATTEITEADCSGCDSCNWCYEFDFALSDGGWAQDPNQVPGCGAYVSGLGWQSTFNVGNNVTGVYINRLFTATQITHIEFEWTLTAPGTSALSYTVVSGGYTNRISTSASALSGSWDGSATVPEITLSVGNSSDGSGAGSAVITRCLMRGVGTNPFGTDNC